jgi:alpha-glucosidase (family GH31 glycosyl hydrolase)
LGVGGYKIDEVDGFDNWLWPDVAIFPSGITAEQMRQIYGLMVQKMTTEWFKEKNRRTYGLVRGSNAGASSFPYVIYNDYYSHQDFITALVNCSFIGVLWTPEVRASNTAEEWLRRIQSVCFSPMAMINAWADGTKPWSFPEVESAVRDVAKLRMQLLPYFYTAFSQYHFQGIPPFRAMNLVEGFRNKDVISQVKSDTTENSYSLSIRQDIKDQYMVGDNLLVAPMFTGQKSRKVILPAGKWYDFYTGDFVGEQQIIETNPELDKIPLFVKDGGIIPMVPVHMHAPTAGEKLSLEVRHYGKADGDYILYDDDGRTYNYENGEYSFTKFIVKRNSNGQPVGSIINDTSGKPYNYNKVSWKFMTK